MKTVTFPDKTEEVKEPRYSARVVAEMNAALEAPSASSGYTRELAHSPETHGLRRAISRIGDRIPSGTEFSQSLRDFARQQLWSWYAFRRAIALELDNLGPRIQMLYRTKLHHHGAYLGPSGRISPTGRDVLCAATFARIADMRCMLANHPKATGWDQEMFLEGWEMGAQWAACTVGNPERRKGNTVEMALNDVMRDLEAIQASRQEIARRIAATRN
jgi:hypothetical protein